MPPMSQASTATTRTGDGGAAATPAKPTLKKYHYSFFAPELAPLRAIYTKILVGALVLTILVSWAFLPLYWGSTTDYVSRSHNLRVLVFDQDGGTIGQVFSSALISSATGDPNTLGFITAQDAGLDVNASADQIGDWVVDEEAWGAVVIEKGASQRLETARQTGDRTYDPTKAVTFYTDIGRNEIASNSYVVPITSALLAKTASTFAAQQAAIFLGTNGGNAQAIQSLASAPQVLTTPAFYTTVSLRPYTTTTASAVTLVGQIYVVIFGFIITMTNDAARAVIAPYLTTSSYIKLRLIVPMIAYLPLSLSYAMVSLPFHLPFDAKYTYAGGFFLFFTLIFVGMLALGLATESIITVLGPRFMAFFLIPWIIVNVSTTVVPSDLQNQLYKYGVAFPVFNMSQAVRTIIFNTKNHLGVNFGVLLVWAFINIVAITFLTWFMRRPEQKEHQRQLEGNGGVEGGEKKLEETEAERENRVEREGFGDVREDR